VTLELQHLRYEQVGGSLLIPVADLVLFAEARVDIRRPVMLGDPDGLLPRTELDRRNLFVGTVGGRYQGLANVMLAAEFSMGSGRDRDASGRPPLLFPVNPATLALRYEHALARERLRLLSVLVASGPRLRSGFLWRSEIVYQAPRAWRIGLGYIHYHPGGRPGPIYGFRRHDRLYVSARWDFTLL
jgi:hypothetical protein